MEYYLLRYACQRGLDCATHHQRLTLLENQLSDDRRQFMDDKAKSENMVYRVLRERHSP